MDPRRVLRNPVIVLSALAALLLILPFLFPRLGVGSLGFVLVATIMGFVLWGTFEAALRADSQWSAIDQNKLVWVLVQMFIPLIGTLVYASAVRPRLMDVATVESMV